MVIFHVLTGLLNLIMLLLKRRTRHSLIVLYCKPIFVQTDNITTSITYVLDKLFIIESTLIIKLKSIDIN